MILHLPDPVQTYFSADKGVGDAVALCFTEDAVVTDEGRSHRGLAAIREWKTGSSKKYSYTSEPFACEDKDGKTVVTSKVTGNFPGSPVNLRYVFGLAGDRIASLEIKP